MPRFTREIGASIHLSLTAVVIEYTQCYDTCPRTRANPAS